MNTFSFVGKIVPVKDKDNFKGYTETVYDSGWMNHKLRFNLVAGDDRHLIEINAGRWQDDKKNSVIYTMSRATENKQSEKIQIPWNERNLQENIDKVAGYRLFTVDTDTYSHRRELKENGEAEALEASNKKRKHFIAGIDFCDWAKKVIYSDKAKDMVFRVSGNINYNYSAKDNMYYQTYEATKITRVDDNTDPSSEINIDFYFTEGAIDTDSYDETGKAIVNGYTQFYDGTTKKNWFAPISLIIRGETDEKGKKKLAGWERVFSKFEDDEIRKIGLSCQHIDGAQRQDIKFEDLDEDTQANIECGLIELEDAIRDAGGQMYGERIQEIRIEKLGRNWSKGSETTVLTVEDCNKKPVKQEEVVDIFGDSDIDDDI